MALQQLKVLLSAAFSGPYMDEDLHLQRSNVDQVQPEAICLASS